MLKQFVLLTIRFYQKFLNFNNPFMRMLFLTDRACRFTPTCSDYMYQAIQQYGILRGLTMGVKRIVRCNPLSAGGYDPVK